MIIWKHKRKYLWLNLRKTLYAYTVVGGWQTVAVPVTIQELLQNNWQRCCAVFCRGGPPVGVRPWPVNSHGVSATNLSMYYCR